MLTGDRAKYFGLVFAIAFCTFLLENQTSIFANILKRTASQILDVTDAEVWVMDPADVARNYAELRGTQRQLRILDETLRSERDTLDLAKARLEAGLGTELDTARAA
jgi:hypothetical protein